jgi:hypothetical protein
MATLFIAVSPLNLLPSTHFVHANPLRRHDCCMRTRTPLANDNFPEHPLPVSMASLIMICTLDSLIQINPSPLPAFVASALARSGRTLLLHRDYKRTPQVWVAMLDVRVSMLCMSDCPWCWRRRDGVWVEVGLCCNGRMGVLVGQTTGGGLVTSSITVIREPVPPRSNGEQLARKVKTPARRQHALLPALAGGASTAVGGAEVLEGSAHAPPEFDPKLNLAWTGRYTALLPDRQLRSSRFDVSHLDPQPVPFSASDADNGCELARSRASPVDPSCHAIL